MKEDFFGTNNITKIKLSKICNQLTEISKFKIIAYLL